jgi:probable phosphoglycerate mutase
MRLYLIRHADPDGDIDRITAAGHLEAQALAKRMEKVRLTRIYSSPLRRARETARYAADVTGIEPVVEDWTCEIADCYYDGERGRVAAWDAPGELIRGEQPGLMIESWDRVDASCAKLVREKFDALRRCSDEFLARHGYQRDGGRYRIVNGGSREQIAIFCHNGTALWWLSHLLEIPLTLVWSGFWHPPSSVTTILFDERSKQWAVPRALGVADTSHLYAAGLPVQPKGIMANFE